MISVELKYGKEIRKISIEEKNLIGEILPRGGDLCVSEEESIVQGLQNPINSLRLKDIVNKGERVFIITSDITRPVPSDRILPHVVNELESGGIAPRDITIVFALGTHRKHTDEEKVKMVGEYIINKGITLLDSDVNDVINYGYCKNGTPIDIYSPITNADRIVCIGNIEYHYFAGYSGGAKAIMPGVSSERAIKINHSNMINSMAVAGQIFGNPVREDIDEVGNHIKIDFIVNVVLNDRKQILRTFAGHYLEAHRAGCDFLDSICRYKVEQFGDVVIASAGGYPKDINMYQAQKALDNAKNVVKEGGIIIWIGAMEEGFGSEVFREWLHSKTTEEILEDIRKEFIIGAHKAVAVAMILKKAKIYIVSEIDQDMLREMGFTPFGSIDEAYSQAIKDAGNDAKVLVMPYAGSTFISE